MMKIRYLTLVALLALLVSACGQKQIMQSEAQLGADALESAPLQEAENPEAYAEQKMAEEPAFFEQASEANSAEQLQDAEGLALGEGDFSDPMVGEENAPSETNSVASNETVEETEEVGLYESSEENFAEPALDEQAVAIVEEVEASTAAPEASVSEIADTAPANNTATSVATFRPSKKPSIPSRAFKENGETVNRYYFMRPGDNAQNLAKVFYGDNFRSTELESINGPSHEWKPGKLLYFRSASNPTDEVMKSFYEERNVVSEAYTIEKGDTLSKIAETRLGNVKNWKEIAVANDLNNPDRIQAGAILFVYPLQLDEYAPTQVASNQLPDIKEMEVFEERKPAVETGAESSSLLAAGQKMEEKAQENLASLKKATSPKQASTGITDFLAHNMTYFLIGLGLLLAGFVGYLMLGEKHEERF